ncbi:MAG: DUF3352 domain-containing protein [Candidatus Brocadiia bacterium]
MKRHGKLLTLAVIAAALCLPALRAEAAVEGYVPQDALAVVKVTDLERHYEEFANSPLLAHLKDPTFMPELAEKIREAEGGIREFERAHDVSARDVLMGLLGREAALAVFSDETGVLVVEAESEVALRDAVDEFQRVQRLTGDLLDTATSQYKGIQVHASEMKDGKTRYHAMSGRALAVSEDRSAVERVIDTAAGAAEAMADSADFGDAMRMAERGALAVGYVGGAALEALSEQIRREAEVPGHGHERLVMRRLAEALPTARFLMLSVLHEEDVSARVTVAYQGNRLPAGLARIFPEEGSRLDVLELAPRNAALVAARSLDSEGSWHSMMDMLREVAPRRAEKTEQVMDMLVNMVGGVYSREELLAEFTGQGALMVLPAETQDAPPAAGLVIGLRETAHLPTAIESIVGAVVTFARAEGKHDVTLNHSEHDGVRLTTVMVDEPGIWARIAPTFGVVEGTMVVTTSPAAARDVVDTARGAARIRTPRADGTLFGAGVMNVRTVSDMLEQYHGFLLRRAMEKDNKPEAQARRELEALGKLLSLVDSVEFAAAFGEGRTDHYLRLDLAHDAR